MSITVKAHNHPRTSLIFTSLCVLLILSHSLLIPPSTTVHIEEHSHDRNHKFVYNFRTHSKSFPHTIFISFYLTQLENREIWWKLRQWRIFQFYEKRLVIKVWVVLGWRIWKFCRNLFFDIRSKWKVSWCFIKFFN